MGFLLPMILLAADQTKLMFACSVAKVTVLALQTASISTFVHSMFSAY